MFAHPLQTSPSPAAGRRCGHAFIDVLAPHPSGMNDIFREIGMRKSLFGQDLDVSPQRPESREFVV